MLWITYGSNKEIQIAGVLMLNFISRTRVQFVSTFTTATGKGRNNEERKEPC